MQVFSAGAATVEGRQARMKLPVGFRRILFLGSPGPSSRVSRKGALHLAMTSSKGTSLYIMRQGKPCVLVDGFRAISLSGAGRSAASGSTRDLTYHVAWQRTPDESSRSDLTPLPLEQVARRGSNCIGPRDRSSRPIRIGGGALRSRRSRRRATGARIAGNGSDAKMRLLMRRRCMSRHRCVPSLNG